MKFFKNLISAPRGCAMMFAVLIAVIALPAVTQAQLASYTARTPKLVSGTAHTNYFTYKPGLFLNGTFTGVFNDTSTTDGNADTLILPGYKQNMRVFAYPHTHSYLLSEPYTPPLVSHLATPGPSDGIKKDTLILTFPRKDTCRYNLLITDR